MVKFYSKIPGFSNIAQSPLFTKLPSSLPDVTASYDSFQIPSVIHTPDVSPYSASKRVLFKSKSEAKSLMDTRSVYNSESHSPLRNYNSQEKVGVVEIGSEWNPIILGGGGGGPRPPKKLLSDESRSSLAIRLNKLRLTNIKPSSSAN